MNDLNKLLKSIRRVGKGEPVTQMQLSEIIRGLWRDPSISSDIVITQENHEFGIGNTIKPTPEGWIKTKADLAENAGTICLVKEVIDADHFKIIGGGLLPGEYEIGAKYFLSSETEGEITAKLIDDFSDGEFVVFIGTGTELGLFIEIDFGYIKQTFIQPETAPEFDTPSTTWLDEQLMTKTNLPINSEKITGIDCSDSGQVVAFCQGIVMYGGRIFISQDYGATWSEARPLGDVDKLWTRIKVSADGSVIYACCTSVYAGQYADGSVVRSTDYGATWTNITPAGTIRNWMTLAINDSGSGLIAGSSYGRLFKSEDYGDNWTELQPAGDTNNMWLDSCCSNDMLSLMVRTAERLYISTDGASFIDFFAERYDNPDILPVIASVKISGNGQRAVIVYGTVWGDTDIIWGSYIELYENGLNGNYYECFEDSYTPFVALDYEIWMSRDGRKIAANKSNFVATATLQRDGDFTYHKIRSPGSNQYICGSKDGKIIYIGISAEYGGMTKLVFRDISASDHEHDLGDLTLLFENNLV